MMSPELKKTLLTIAESRMDSREDDCVKAIVMCILAAECTGNLPDMLNVVCNQFSVPHLAAIEAARGATQQ